jgi:hypothetical protein
VKVSVLTRDDALRERILNTARAIEGTDHYGCTPRQPRGHHSMIDSIDDVTAVDICEYYNGSLVAGSALTSPQTTAFDQALSVVRNFVVSRAGSCPQAPHFFVMTVHTHSTTRLVSFGVSPCRRPTNNVIFWGPHQQPQPLSHPAASPSTR